MSNVGYKIEVPELFRSKTMTLELVKKDTLPRECRASRSKDDQTSKKSRNTRKQGKQRRTLPRQCWRIDGEPEFKGYGPENSKKESNVVKESDNSKENSDKSLVKEQESQVKSSFVEGCGSNTSKRVSEGEPKKVRENNDAPIIEEWGKPQHDEQSIVDEVDAKAHDEKVYKFDGKSDEGVLCWFTTLRSKAFRKDTSYFDSPIENVDNGEPKTADDAQKKDEDGLNNENAEQERFSDDSSSKDVNVVGQQVNSASPDLNTGSLELNVVGPSLKPRSDKESPEVERTNDEEVEVTNVVISVNVNEVENEIIDEVYELKRREKGNIVEESRSTPLPTPIRSPRTHTNLVSLDTKKLQELTETHTQTTSSSRSQHTKLSRANRLLSLFKAKPALFKRYKNFFQELEGRYTYLFKHLKERFLSRKSFDTLTDHLQEVMVESLPIIVDTHIKEQRDNIQAEISSQIQKAIDNQIPSQVDVSVRSYMSGHILHVYPAQTQTLSVPEQQYQLYLSMKDNLQLQQQDIDYPHDDAHPDGENSAKRHKTSEYEAYVSGESSSRQVNEEERGLSTSGNQEQEDDYDFWTDSYASDDDEIPSKQVSQDIMEEVSLTIDEAKLKKMDDEML
ncbi:hypothetical protein Tco_0458521 [Tanacetum coccineum]